jgi:hypothetical protein
MQCFGRKFGLSHGADTSYERGGGSGAEGKGAVNIKMQLSKRGERNDEEGEEAADSFDGPLYCRQRQSLQSQESGTVATRETHSNHSNHIFTIHIRRKNATVIP